MYTKEELFQNDFGLNSLHDIFVEFIDKQLKDEMVLELFDRLPEHTRNEAHCWGLSDTVFRDDAYLFFRDNFNIVEEVITTEA